MRSTLLLCALAARAAAQTVPVTTTTLDTRACMPGGPFAAAVYCNPKAALEDRVNDLVERLFAGDAASWVPPQLTARHGGGGSPGPMSNVSAVGLPEWNFGLNCAHGVQSSCARDAAGVVRCPTSFHNTINSGATWDDDLTKAMGAVISEEARALWVAGMVEESTWSGRKHIAPECWSPNIVRSPRRARWASAATHPPNNHTRTLVPTYPNP
jgi:hypothetical protein